MTEGKITRGSKVRLIRDGTVVYDGEVASLRRFNEDVREVAAGFDCGIVLRDFADIKEGDVLEAYATRQVERELPSVRRDVLRERLCGRARDPPPLSRGRKPQEQAEGALINQGATARTARRRRVRRPTMPRTWQRATLTAALTGGSLATLSSAVAKVERWLDGRCPDGVRVERVFASVEDLHDVFSRFGAEG